VTPMTIGILRAVHILAAIFWTGVMMMNAAFLMPAVRAAGPAGGQVMRQLVQARRLPRYINLAVLLTLLTGTVLLWWTSGGFAGAWLASRKGIVYQLGAACTLLTALVGQFVNGPTARRLGGLGAAIERGGQPPTPAQQSEMRTLQSRLAAATRLAALLLSVAAVAMAMARYV
jgi:uncharacterized membrane protein